MTEGLIALGEHAHRAHRADTDRFDEARDRRQHLRQRHVAGDLFEHLALGGGHAFTALAPGDIGDAEKRTRRERCERFAFA